ncbi:MAG: LemA protein [Thermoleophilaceae bacterium]|jgi:LemA protein|nr:LemA protein [Thermoleophilaceae bacterium]
MVALIVIVAVIVVLGLLLVTTYNRLVQLRVNCESSFAQIDVQLKRRTDLIPNLVETVKGYAAHERGTFEAVTQARAAAVSAQGSDPAERAQAENMLTRALGGLLAIAEAYPDLKANQNFLELQTELSDTEDKISVARQVYNDVVNSYNSAIQVFPAVLIAGMMGFQKREFFEADEGSREAPQVSFAQ